MRFLASILLLTTFLVIQPNQSYAQTENSIDQQLLQDVGNLKPQNFLTPCEKALAQGYKLCLRVKVVDTEGNVDYTNRAVLEAIAQCNFDYALMSALFCE